MNQLINKILLVSALGGGLPVWAYDSGSSGADGAFNPGVDTTLALPANGILNFTTVNIPTGVTVTFSRNNTNTPVFMLATGDVVIDGIIDISGGASPEITSEPSGSDGKPGLGGPGGYDGGEGGFFAALTAGVGRGPGGGGGGDEPLYPLCVGGGGGSFKEAGDKGGSSSNCHAGNGIYGSDDLVPLIGGSGGGGGVDVNSSPPRRSQGGAGGGGAILIASSGVITVNGAIDATGGKPELVSPGGSGSVGSGGSGSGGAIRLVAETIAGEGALSALGGSNSIVTSCGTSCNGGEGSIGRIRLETVTLDRGSNTTPTYSRAVVPGPAFPAPLPSLAITAVGGIVVPAAPTGAEDVLLPATIINPVSIDVVTTNIPVGTTINVSVSGIFAAAAITSSDTVVGTDASGTASVSLTLPDGGSFLQATTSFTVVASLGDALSRYAMGERVQSVSLLASVEGNVTEFTTVSGKTFRYPSDQVGQLAAKG